MSLQRRLASFGLVAVLASACLFVANAPVSANRAEMPRDASASEVQSAKLFSAGMYFTCLGANDGTVKCWGDNTYGQIGNGVEGGAAAYVATPTQVSGLSNVREISVGAYHACALLSDTSVKCWGYNTYGQLGNGSTTNAPIPVAVQNVDGSATLTGVATISAGYDTTCAAMAADGAVYCWGVQADGKLGNGQSGWAARTRPVAVEVSSGVGLTGIVELEGALPATCGISSSATLYCWGMATWAAGDGSNSRALRAKSVPGLTGVRAVSVGGEHVCALATGGAFCWGGSTDYPYGEATVATSPTLVRSSGVTQIVAGLSATCILQTDKKVQCVGSFLNYNGTLQKSVLGGNADGEIQAFTDVPGIAGATLVVMGGNHACVQGDGIRCWGRNDFAQVGSGSRSDANQAVTIAIAAVSQTVTFADVSAKTVTSDRFEVVATSDAGNPVTFTVAESSASVCSVSGAEVTILGSGNCVIKAIAAARGVYAEGSASKTIVIAAVAPSAATSEASVVTMTTATLSASVNPRGASTTVKFEYGTSASLVSAQSVDVAGSQSGNTERSVSADLSGLAYATTVYFRVVATNSVGTSTGEIKSFTTKGAKPIATTGSASRTSGGVTVNGKVNAKDLDTSIQFEYGTDAKLVGSTLTAAISRAGTADEDVSALLSGLTEKTTYFYRVVATNVVGKSEGEIRSFTTTMSEGVSINDGEEFTSSQKVTVSVVGPSTAVKAILSNDGGFKTSETFDLVNNSAEIPWQLQSSREGTFTKIVYVKYVSRFGSQSTPYTDDIILDTTKPVVSTATAAAGAAASNAVTVSRVGVSAKKAAGGVRLSVRGSDTVSGIGTIEVRSAANKPAAKVKIAKVSGKADGKPRVASQTVSLNTTAKRLQVRVLDRAGNASAWRTIVVK